ncbi:hypothetical protein LCGC14_0422360 [marine sediment metagenome]|uniref:HTH luxR-type domain-containing protein n=1 Tax=marine sediment metagenome TaxID=412755 RepID=A0A0F9VCP1_9ZZZZ
MNNIKHIKAVGSLSKIKLEILGLVAQGYTNNEIAFARDVDPNTINYHLRATADKLCISRASRVHLAVEYTKWRLANDK